MNGSMSARPELSGDTCVTEVLVNGVWIPNKGYLKIIGGNKNEKETLGREI